MKKICYLFFALAAGAASAYGQTPPGAASVHGQRPPAAMDLSQGKLHLTSPPSLTINGFLTEGIARALIVTTAGPTYRLMPDHMPCLIPDMALVERMPVDRSFNADAMPNKSHSGPRLLAVPGNRMPNGMDGMKIFIQPPGNK